MSDGVVAIRSPIDGDQVLLLAGPDAESRRWLGKGDDYPSPTACIVVCGNVVEWVDYGVEREWLAPDQVNVGYQIFPEHRGRGYATRAVRLLIEHLAATKEVREIE